jgi:hypothetical protein
MKIIEISSCPKFKDGQLRSGGDDVLDGGSVVAE